MKATATKERDVQPTAVAAVPAVLDEALSRLDADERAGALFRASGLRLLIEMPDLGAAVSIATVSSGESHVEWSFDAATDWEPRLVLRIDSDIANRFLQGRESLAIAVARGRVKVQGDPRFTLLYIPALRLLVEPYRAAVRHRAPELAVD